MTARARPGSLFPSPLARNLAAQPFPVPIPAVSSSRSGVAWPLRSATGHSVSARPAAGGRTFRRATCDAVCDLDVCQKPFDREKMKPRAPFIHPIRDPRIAANYLTSKARGVRGKIVQWHLRRATCDAVCDLDVSQKPFDRERMKPRAPFIHPIRDPRIADNYLTSKARGVQGKNCSMASSPRDLRCRV